MIGLIPKVLIDLILNQSNPQTLQNILMDSGLPADQVFAINRSYPDEDWRRLFSNTLSTLNINEQQACELYADAFFNTAIELFPNWFKMASNSYDFLQMQPKIHNSFASGLSDSHQRQQTNDKFQIEVQPNHIITHYQSPNQLCTLYISLAQRLAQLYGDTVDIEHSRCLKNGDKECTIHVYWR